MAISKRLRKQKHSPFGAWQYEVHYAGLRRILPLSIFLNFLYRISVLTIYNFLQRLHYVLMCTKIQLLLRKRFKCNFLGIYAADVMTK